MTLELSEEQVLAFRLRRSVLQTAPDAASAAKRMLGAQGQNQAPGLWSLALRCAEPPTAAELQKQLLQPPRQLVRTWGQRGTLHIYHPDDWHRLVAARPQWPTAEPRDGKLLAHELAAARQVLLDATDPVVRSDLFAVIASATFERLTPEIARARMSAEAFIARRLLWNLARDGHACAAGKLGREQGYAAREVWFPQLAWPDPLPAPEQAARELARRYLGSYGPARAQDLAHFFGSKPGIARSWLAALEEQGALVPVQCGGRRGLCALAEDASELQAARIPADGAVRLLPLWDTLLMAHADKSWTVPLASELKRIWTRSTYLSATVLAEGRVVATWSQKRKRGRLQISLQPLSRWREEYRAGVRRHAQVLAAHLGLAGSEV